MDSKPVNKLWGSLRTRIVLSIVVMILPAAVLMYSAYTAIRSNIDSLTHIVDAHLDEVVSTQEIQRSILRTELPFYLYMNRGETADREAFIRLAVEIDLKFENFNKKISAQQTEKRLLETAQSEWLAAKSLGESLLTTSNIPENDILVAKIDQFSRHLERSASMLEEFSKFTLDEINVRRFNIQDSEWKTLSMLILVFALGLLLAMLASISLGQSVIEPIRRLERTVSRFGQGDTSSRINVKSNDELGSLASAFNQLAERYEQIKQELDYLSVHDNLTGLYDQTKLLQEVGLEIERARRYDRSFSILLIDIENFKEVNRRYGRLVGDSVLCSVADKIVGSIRPTDIASRYGGDEFGVILSETDAKGAIETSQRIIEAIRNNPLNIGDGKTLTISVRIGQSTYPSDAENESALFAYAEQLLVTSREPIARS
ncbi:MAG: diguanylate cyclase [Gammaproteobacteria bacterium]|nr:diguanylate cyclase [Gammaproteobacteria bacterium]